MIMRGERQKVKVRGERAKPFNIMQNYLLMMALCLALFVAPLPVRGLVADDTGVRADLPAGGELRIENRRGSVSVELWNEKHVSVTASIEGTRASRSPVIIQRTERLLTIGVARDAATSARVDLSLRIPERSRVEIITTGGEIDVRGLPNALSVQTVSGDIRAKFPSSTNADVTAESVNGSVALTDCAPTTTASARNNTNTEHSARCRMGAGGRLVRLRSERGRITLAASDAAQSTTTTTASTERRAPTLVDAKSNKPGAGTPADPSTGPQEVDEDDVIRVDTELVTLNVSVIDRGTSRGLAGLAKPDFKLYEDGNEQQIAHFDSSAAPFNMVLLIDLSGSTREVVEIIKTAAQRFVEATRPSDRIAVITFANTPLIVSALTNDREALRQRINAIELPQGSTRLYDSIGFTLDEVLKYSKDSGRNAIILMSDGLDSTLPNVRGEGSTLDYKELLVRIQEFDGVFYTLWVDTEVEALSPEDVQPETVDLAHDRMREMSEAGGGAFYEVEKLEDLAGAYERVVADLGTVYSLGYRPSNKLRDGKWRSIRVAVARPNAVARGKRGYFAN
jgi:VWFA-related protein